MIKSFSKLNIFRNFAIYKTMEWWCINCKGYTSICCQTM